LLGKWWDKDKEIDIVGIDRENNRILFAEVKWRSIGKREAIQVIEELKKKSESVEWGKSPEKLFMLVAKEEKQKNEMTGEAYSIFDLEVG